MEKQISHFKILEEIGSGGMGVVYRARDTRLKRKVALKVLPAAALAEPTIRERLEREAQTASALNHPHIVTVYEIHLAGDRDFIAMEFVEGQSLDHLIGEEGLPLERALRYALQIADGLSCAHEHGVIHRDLKPQNIMIMPSDDVKILDFGLAKRFLPPGVRADSSGIQPMLMTLTAPGVKVGTPAYMSPEQIESRAIDARSDVFSFGCLFYEMLTGVSPFHRRNAILIFKAVLSDDPEPARILKPNLPEKLEGILTRAMEKVPEDRYQSMRKLLADLEAVQAELFGTDSFQVRPGGLPKAARDRARAWLPTALTALALVALAAAFWIVGRSAPGPLLTGHRAVSGFQSSLGQASFSPAGDRLAYVADDPRGVPQIWVRALAGGLPTAVTSSGVATERPSWFPAAAVAGNPNESGRLLFSRPGGGIWALALEPGGTPRQILDLGANPRWSPDGSRLVVEHSGGLWIADAEGGGLEELDSVPRSFFARWVPRSPSFAPDGDSIVYFHPEVGAAGSLWIATPDSEPRRLLEGSFRGGEPVWSVDGKRIVFSADLGGEINLWSVPAGGGEPVQLTREAGRHSQPVLSADGRRIAYTTARPSSILKLRSASGGEMLLLESRDEIARPVVSPAGDRIAFSATSGPDVQLFTVATEGATVGVVRQITTGAGERNVLPRWSADGSYLYFYQEQPTRSLRKVSAAGGESSEVLADWSEDRYYNSIVGPLERRVAYLPLADGSPGKLRVREIESGRELELGAILLGPRWSPDGGLILGSDAEDRMYLCPASGGGCRFLAEGFEPRWGPEEGAITFARREAPARQDRILKLSIWTRTLDGLEESKIGEIETFGPLAFGYGVLSDGSLVWNQLRSGRRELWLADLE